LKPRRPRFRHGTVPAGKRGSFMGVMREYERF
jgi:hypothetical protein